MFALRAAIPLPLLGLTAYDWAESSLIIGIFPRFFSSKIFIVYVALGKVVVDFSFL